MEIFARDVRMISGNPDTHTGYLHGVWVSEAGVTVSDRRFKKDVAPIEFELMNKFGKHSLAGLLNQLRPVAYSLIEDGEPQMNRRFGFIAQELEAVIPDLVYDIKETGTKSVLYEDIIAILTAALQEHIEKVTKMEEVIKRYDEAIKKSEADLSRVNGEIRSLSETLISLERRLNAIEQP